MQLTTIVVAALPAFALAAPSAPVAIREEAVAAAAAAAAAPEILPPYADPIIVLDEVGAEEDGAVAEFLEGFHGPITSPIVPPPIATRPRPSYGQYPSYGSYHPPIRGYRSYDYYPTPPGGYSTYGRYHHPYPRALDSRQAGEEAPAAEAPAIEAPVLVDAPATEVPILVESPVGGAPIFVEAPAAEAPVAPEVTLP